MCSLTDFVNLKIKLTHSFVGAYRGMLCVRVFIRVSDRICVYQWVCDIPQKIYKHFGPPAINESPSAAAQNQLNLQPTKNGLPWPKVLHKPYLVEKHNEWEDEAAATSALLHEGGGQQVLCGD
jgi:hypothetical protein